jgi:hypothetical protein
MVAQCGQKYPVCAVSTDTLAGVATAFNAVKPTESIVEQLGKSFPFDSLDSLFSLV